MFEKELREKKEKPQLCWSDGNNRVEQAMKSWIQMPVMLRDSGFESG